MSFERPSPSTATQTQPYLYLPAGDDRAAAGGSNGDVSSWDQQVDDQHSRDQEKMFENGVLEGEKRVRVVLEKQLANAVAVIPGALEAFRREREQYFSRIEPEVVQLALAIARKILHREAQMDPLLLTGMVHVALEKLDSGVRVRMRANPADIGFWNEHFCQPGAFQPPPELIGDADLHRGECALETEIGSTQISLDTQLKEIEQGFFDLLDQRPRAR